MPMSGLLPSARVTPPPMNRELLRVMHAVNREPTMQGINLNKIAKHLNGNQIPLDDAEGLIGQIARSLFRAHQAVQHIITQEKVWPEEE